VSPRISPCCEGDNRASDGYAHTRHALLYPTSSLNRAIGSAAGTGSLMTQRWREMDSNHRSRRGEGPWEGPKWIFAISDLILRWLLLSCRRLDWEQRTASDRAGNRGVGQSISEAAGAITGCGGSPQVPVQEAQALFDPLGRTRRGQSLSSALFRPSVRKRVELGRCFHDLLDHIH
jgi:hypothetical protein